MAAAAAAPAMPSASPQPIPQPSPAQPQSDSRPELPRPYKCPLCDKAFHRLEHQTRHIRTHTGEKPHACTFPGCTKKFSRSDELTRHTRIHNNPNSRRGKQQNHAAMAAAMNGAQYPEHAAMAHVMGPPPLSSYSGPNSGVNSPNVSPPHVYSQRASHQSTPYGSFSGSTYSPDGYSHNGRQQYAGGMNILAHAASRAAEHENISPYASHSARHPQYYSGPSYNRSTPHYDPQQPFSARNGLAAYHYDSNTNSQPSSYPSSHPMSRTHSQDEEEHYSQHAHRAAKRSRPGSPFSTNPPSPTFSTDSISPTPGHTPAITPGHSPRLRATKPGHGGGYNLPGIRDLSLAHVQSPALEPLEPAVQASGSNTPHHPYSRSQNNSSAGLRIADIMNKSDGTQRKLPVPSTAGMSDDLPSLDPSGHERMEL